MRIVNPNRKEDELETKALGCNCKCSKDYHDIGQAGAWVPVIPGCGCIVAMAKKIEQLIVVHITSHNHRKKDLNDVIHRAVLCEVYSISTAL